MPFPPPPKEPSENEARRPTSALRSTAWQPPPPEQHASPQPPPRLPPRLTPEPKRPEPARTEYDHERARWGLGDMVGSLAVYFVGSLSLVLLIITITGDDSFLSGPWLPVAVVGPHAMLLAHLLWVNRSKGRGLATDFRLSFEWSDLGLGLGLFFGGVIAAGLVATAITALSGETLTASAVELAQDSSDGGGVTIWLILFAILGATFVPLVEELVYRGLLWSALEKRGMRPWPVLVVSSLIFALIHLEPLRTPVLFAIGMAIGAGRLITGRIGASIVAHIVINSLAMTATVVELA